MDIETLKIVGQIAGLGGLALGVFLILYRNLIRRLFEKIPILDKKHAYQLLRMILTFVWSITVIGMLLWAYLTNGSQGRKEAKPDTPSVEPTQNKNVRPRGQVTDTLIDKNTSK